jgi:hypothetical protein
MPFPSGYEIVNATCQQPTSLKITESYQELFDNVVVNDITLSDSRHEVTFASMWFSQRS